MIDNRERTIRFDATGLHCMREERTLFDELSFSLGPGELLQVEGCNGSGKTTLLRVLCGLKRPDGGAVLWCGEAIDAVFPDFAAQLAYVAHTPGLKESLTPLENLSMAAALGGPRNGMAPEDALERLGLPEGHEELPCYKLSAGQRRRVALGRLLLSSARLWILDEPFTALDVSGRALVNKLLLEHAARGGMAIFTTHHTMDLEGASVRAVHLS